MEAARGGNHQITMRGSPLGVYGPLMAESNAVIASALARVDRMPARRLPGHGVRIIIEHRHGSGTERRIYGVSPLRAPIMANVQPFEPDPRFNPRLFVRPQQTAAPGSQGSAPHLNAAGTATAGDGGADASAVSPAASVPAVGRMDEGSGETRRPGRAAGHPELRRAVA